SSRKAPSLYASSKAASESASEFASSAAAASLFELSSSASASDSSSGMRLSSRLRRRRPNASLSACSPQFTGGQLPKQTLTLHWKRKLFEDGNLNALNRATSDFFAVSYS